MDLLSSIYAFQYGAIELNRWNTLLHLGNYPSMLLGIITYQVFITVVYKFFPETASKVILIAYTILKVLVSIHNVFLIPPPVIPGVLNYSTTGESITDNCQRPAAPARAFTNVNYDPLVQVVLLF